MKPKDFIAQQGTDYFTLNKGKVISLRLRGDNELVIKGHFIGILRVGE